MFNFYFFTEERIIFIYYKLKSRLNFHSQVTEYVLLCLILLYTKWSKCHQSIGYSQLYYNLQYYVTLQTFLSELATRNEPILKHQLSPAGGVATVASPTSAAPSAAFFRPQPSAAQRSAALRSSVMKKLSKKMSEVMDQSSRPSALKGLILKGCRSSKKAGLGIFLGFHTPC